MSRNELVTPEAVIHALQENRGIKLRAAKSLGVSRWTVDNMCDRYPEVQRAWLDERDKMVDRAEGGLYEIIEDKGHDHHFNAIQFYLGTVGRERGYDKNLAITLEMMKQQLGDISGLDLDKLNNKEVSVLRDLLIKAQTDRPPDRTEPTQVTSEDFTAKQAIKMIRKMDRVSDVVKFAKTDKRKTVSRAAKQRKNAIKNQSKTDD